MVTKEPPSLLQAIARISNFSYEPSIVKYPFLKEYLKKEKDPKMEWTLWMTAAGVGYALSKKEEYPGEHNELIKSIVAATIDGLPKIVESFVIYIQDIYKNKDEFYLLAIGFWVITRIKKGKPTSEELKKLPQDIGKLLTSTIQDYEAEKVKSLGGR